MFGDVIPADALDRMMGHDAAPLLLDVRRQAIFESDPFLLPAAMKADASDPAATLPPGYSPARPIVCYCAHGHQLGAQAAALLRAQGLNAAALTGGLEAWRAAGLPVFRAAPGHGAALAAGGLWITRRRPKIDRIACPWFIRRFIDARARFLFVDADAVLPIADELGAIAFDIPGAPITHQGDLCSFDALLDHFAVSDPVLRDLAITIRGADTARPQLAPAAAGLLDISLGAAALETDDLALLNRLMPVYDALYARARFAKGERHDWQPAAA